jgi:UDP-N-acetylmuramoyl-tripeptide--D-alanyl-D-alanine ligase
MFILLNTLWFVWELKYILFWLYLWQLKEYHVGRFVDHFRTSKGKRLIFSLEQIFKLILFILLFLDQNLFNYIFSAIFILYAIESIIFLRAILKGSLKKPKITFKTLFLALISFSFVYIFLYLINGSSIIVQPALILGFDVLTPIIISLIVLLFQPVSVLLRNSTIKKASDQMKEIKSASRLKVIAITGSYGKTSTKEFLSIILSKKYNVLNTREHQNSEICIARTILHDLKPEHEIFIAEVGAYNKGKVREVCLMLNPDIGIVTGVNEQHLSLFGSMKNLLLAEGGGELAVTLLDSGTLIVNGDNKYCLDLCKKFDGRKKIYSLTNKIIDSDIWSESITVHKNSISFLALDKSGNLAHFGVNVLGQQNVQNLLGSILIAKELGMTFGEISEACKEITHKDAGMILKTGKHDIEVVDSSYSSNPDGVFADLDYLSVFTTKKIIVMPCLIELGQKSSEIHERIGQKIGRICDLAIITSKDRFEDLKKGAIFAGMQEKDFILCDNPQDIYSMITLFSKSDDVVLLEGRVPPKLIEFLSQ